MRFSGIMPSCIDGQMQCDQYMNLLDEAAGFLGKLHRDNNCNLCKPDELSLGEESVTVQEIGGLIQQKYRELQGFISLLELMK